MPRENAKALEAALASARALVATLEAALAEPDDRPTLLDVKCSLAEYGVGRDGLLAAAGRGELELKRGPRRRILVARDELERWLRSRPHRPAPRRSVGNDDLAAWDAEQERELRALAGAQNPA